MANIAKKKIGKPSVKPEVKSTEVTVSVADLTPTEDAIDIVEDIQPEETLVERSPEVLPEPEDHNTAETLENVEEKTTEISVPEISVSVPDVTYTPAVKEYSDAKKTRVRLAVNHKCFIGGEWYFFTKGEAYNVPENVKRILSEANLLAPL